MQAPNRPVLYAMTHRATPNSASPANSIGSAWASPKRIPVATIAERRTEGPTGSPADPHEGLEQKAPEEHLFHERDHHDREHRDDREVRSVKSAGQTVGRLAQLVMRDSGSRCSKGR